MQGARPGRQLAEARHLKGASFHQLAVQGRKVEPSSLTVGK